MVLRLVEMTFGLLLYASFSLPQMASYKNDFLCTLKTVSDNSPNIKNFMSHSLTKTKLLDVWKLDEFTLPSFQEGILADCWSQYEDTVELGKNTYDTCQDHSKAGQLHPVKR